MTLNEYAQRLGISYSAAKGRFRSGQIPGAYKDPRGRVVIPDKVIEGKPVTVKLARFAEENGVSYRTALRMFHNGKIPGAFRLGGKTILVPRATDYAARTMAIRVSENNAVAVGNWFELTKAILLNRYKPLVAKKKIEEMEAILGYRMRYGEDK